jgi:uncharacterized RDD family membrane protein YckC
MARFCAQCGKQLRSRSKFCPNCGSINLEAEAFGRTARVSDRGGATLEMPAPAEAGRDMVGTTTPNERVRTRHFAPPTHSLVGPYEQAGFGLRFGALLFDLLTMMMAWMAATFLLSYLSNKSVVSSNGMLAAVYLVAFGLFLVNFVLLAGLSGKTIGKHIIGIRIVREDGEPLGPASAAYRHLVGYPLSALGAFLGFLWILWDPKQQGWHDKLVRTMVVIR